MKHFETMCKANGLTVEAGTELMDRYYASEAGQALKRDLNLFQIDDILSGKQEEIIRVHISGQPQMAGTIIDGDEYCTKVTVRFDDGSTRKVWNSHITHVKAEVVEEKGCTCHLFPETEPRQCADCDLAEYLEELRYRTCASCGEGLEDLSWGDNPDEWPLICDFDAAMFNDEDPDDAF